MSEDMKNAPGGATDGYVSDSTQGQIPLKGHMVTFRFKETTYGPEEVGYEAMVEKARELGLGEDHVPEPLFGGNAYKAAVSTLRLPERVCNAENWDHQKCYEKWVTERIRGSRDYKFALCRVRQGKRNGSDYIESTPVYAIQYVKQGEGDCLMRDWHNLYVKSVWGRLEDDERVPEDSFIADCIRMTPWAGGAVSNVTEFGEKMTAVQQRFQEVLQRVRGRDLRSAVKKQLARWSAIPWQASSGGVYVIPDRDGNKSYLPTLEAMADLIEWWSTRTSGVTSRFDMRRQTGEEGEGVEASSTFSRRGTQRTALRLLGYLDDARTIEYLRRDIAEELGAQLGEYYSAIDESLRRFDPENTRVFNRSMNMLLARKSRLEYNMRGLGIDFIDGVEVDANRSRVLRNSIRNRIAGITGTANEDQVARIRNLMAVDTTAGISFEEEE